MAQYKISSLVAVFLDTGVLGFATQKPGVNPNADTCQKWVRTVVAAGVTVILPEIADYEQRREMLRAANLNAIARLDNFTQNMAASYLPIGTPSLREAARQWAVLRNTGLPTASRDALDGDAILAGQVFEWCAANGVPTTSVAVATTNVSDLSRFADANGDSLPAAIWQDILP